MRIDPSAQWCGRAHKAFCANRGHEPTNSAGPSRTFLLGLYRQGFTAIQAGKLMAFLARCEADKKMDAMDYFNVGFLECSPYTKGLQSNVA